MKVSRNVSLSIGVLVFFCTFGMTLIATRMVYQSTEKSLRNQSFTTAQLVTDGMVHTALGKEPLFLDTEAQKAGYSTQVRNREAAIYAYNGKILISITTPV
ncbi:MAG: hypothetical protein LBF75_02945 [Treponema sp.]|jgi:hypothetical protein|nr:hypothetical protein [Treponema sp.]